MPTPSCRAPRARKGNLNVGRNGRKVVLTGFEQRLFCAAGHRIASGETAERRSFASSTVTSPDPATGAPQPASLESPARTPQNRYSSVRRLSTFERRKTPAICDFTPLHVRESRPSSLCWKTTRLGQPILLSRMSTLASERITPAPAPSTGASQFSPQPAVSAASPSSMQPTPLKANVGANDPDPAQICRRDVPPSVSPPTAFIMVSPRKRPGVCCIPVSTLHTPAIKYRQRNASESTLSSDGPRRSHIPRADNDNDFALPLNKDARMMSRGDDGQPETEIRGRQVDGDLLIMHDVARRRRAARDGDTGTQNDGQPETEIRGRKVDGDLLIMHDVARRRRAARDGDTGTQSRWRSAHHAHAALNMDEYDTEGPFAVETEMEVATPSRLWWKLLGQAHMCTSGCTSFHPAHRFFVIFILGNDEQHLDADAARTLRRTTVILCERGATCWAIDDLLTGTSLLGTVQVKKRVVVSGRCFKEIEEASESSVATWDSFSQCRRPRIGRSTEMTASRADMLGVGFYD
ncbi:hypothetical protein K438DRAFT_1768569 [Mycena galopus ATCC 62051]|nr:hypothetical protein K438DRAFT_1768569 [Mycena galopus ATCC 62051]